MLCVSRIVFFNHGLAGYLNFFFNFLPTSSMLCQILHIVSLNNNSVDLQKDLTIDLIIYLILNLIG